MKATRRFRSVLESIRSYRLRSLFLRNYFLIFVLVIVPLIASSVIVYVSVRGILDEQVRTLQENGIARIRDVLDMLFREADKLAIRLGSDRQIDEFLSLKRGERPDFEEITRYQNVLQTLSISTLDYIYSIYVYSERNEYVLSSWASPGSLSLFYEIGWHPVWLSRRGESQGFALLRSIPEAFQSPSSRDVYSVFRSVPLNSSAPTGVVIVNMDVERLRQLTASTAGGLTEGVFVLDPQARLLFSSPRAESALAAELALSAAIRREPGSIASEMNERGDIVSVAVSEYNGFTYASVMRTEEYTRRLATLTRLIASFALGSLVAAIAAAGFISFRLYRPIREILAFLQDPRSGGGPEAGRVGSGEVVSIESNIFRYVETTDRLREELASSLTTARAAQTVALQSQINPHFLFNTLQTVNWMAIRLTGGDNEVSRALVSLSQLLRLSLESDSPITTLERELEHARLYVDMQTLRYGNLFSVEWDVVKDALGCRVLKLMLQPLIENAIYHGIKPLTQRDGHAPGRITIRAERGDGLLDLQIQDNGVGMDPERVPELNRSLQQGFREQQQHIGLRNVNQRIRLIFGDRFGVSVSNAPDGGFVARIQIPAIEAGP